MYSDTAFRMSQIREKVYRIWDFTLKGQGAGSGEQGEKRLKIKDYGLKFGCFAASHHYQP